MKYVAVFMVVLVLLAAALGIYTYANIKLQVAEIKLQAYPATQQETDFLGWQAAVDNGAVSGTAFAESIPGTADDYSYFVYTLRLRNRGLIDAEMVEIQPVPVNGDVLSYSTTDMASINANTVISAGSERDVWNVIITSKQNQDNHIVTRSFYITYYIWGLPVTVTAVYN
ncbi:MAG: hypothetical protein II343_06585 [Clostridia bacterium]|nr:hypothetical protein [Clostridia bacterium]